MGVSISLHVYDKDKLVKSIDDFVQQEGGYREGAHRADSFLELVGNEFGRLTPTEFHVVWNDYYKDYNPAANFLHAVDKYFFPERDEDDEPPQEYMDKTGRRSYNTFWSSDYKTYSEGANASEVLSDLFEDEFGYEGKFSDRWDEE